MTHSWNLSAFGHFLLDSYAIIHSVSDACEGILNKPVSQIQGQKLFDILDFDAKVYDGLKSAIHDNRPIFVSDCDVWLQGEKKLTLRLGLKPYQDMAVLCIAPCDLAARGHEHQERAVNSTIGLAQMLAHEVKNPLAGIAGAAQLLAQDLTRTEDRELTDLIVEETKRVTRMLSQVEQFGDLRDPQMNPHNIHDVLRQAVQSVRLGVGHDMPIIEEYDPSLPEVIVDRDHLFQIVLNLVKNAAEAVSGTAGIIKIRTSYDSGFRKWLEHGQTITLPVQVEVIDTGRGIPEHLRSSLFEPFVSGRENGTGLGLALVRKLIQQNGASIALQASDNFTSFRVSLPISLNPIAQNQKKD